MKEAEAADDNGPFAIEVEIDYKSLSISSEVSGVLSLHRQRLKGVNLHVSFLQNINIFIVMAKCIPIMHSISMP